MSDELQYEVVNSMLLDVAHVCGYAMNVNQIQHVSQRSYGVGSFNGYSLVSKLPYVEYLCILHLLDSMLVFIKNILNLNMFLIELCNLLVYLLAILAYSISYPVCS